MTKRAEAKYKIDRRMGENIWGRPKSPYNKREYGPGQHGQRRKGKATDFGTQLKAKQKVKGYYGNISERQFHKYYQEAVRVRGAPVRQSRPSHGQRQTRQHSLLSGEGRRRRADQGIVAPDADGHRGGG